jgi:hypothetical protein
MTRKHKPKEHRPREEPPLPPPPRPVRARRGRGLLRGCLVLLLIPHIWCGAFLPAWGVVRLVDFLHFRLAGFVVPGLVSRVEARHGRGGAYHQVYYTYRFRGHEYPADTRVDGPDPGGLAEGQSVEVRVLPGPGLGPQLLVPGAVGPGDDLWKMALFTLVWDGAMMVIVWPNCIRPLRQRSLVRAGLATPGRVTDREEGDRRKPYRVHYRYRPPSETEDRQGVMTVTKDEHYEVQVGDQLNVLYHPRKPRRSLLHRFAAYEAVPPA